MRRFYLQRDQDASGVSGLGKVAEGCQFDTGWCALVWLTGKSAMSYYPDIETIEEIHGHQGMTKVKWVDSESSNVIVRYEPPACAWRGCKRKPMKDLTMCRKHQPFPASASH